MTDPTDEDIRIADSISVVSCEHGTVYVRLHDQAGQIFAVAAMPSSTARRFRDDILTAIDEAAGDAIGECQGHG